MKESESGESNYERAHESEAAESAPASHGPAVRKEIESHKGGHVPFPTLGSSGGAGTGAGGKGHPKF